MSRFLTKQDMEDLALQDETVPQLFSIRDLDDTTPRTLVFGYTADRFSHHLYINKKYMVTLAIYDLSRLLSVKFDAIPYSEVFPNKRVYPECCDLELCQFMVSKGFRPSFTNYDSNRPHPFHIGPYWGRLLVDLED